MLSLAADAASVGPWPLPVLELLGVFVFGLSGASPRHESTSMRWRC